MNILLWVLQAVLAFFFLSGGGYKVFKVENLASHFHGFPPNAWRALGVIEMVGAVLLLVPTLTPLAAAVLAVESLALAAAYARKSVKLVAANPFVWCFPMGLVAAVIAYARYAQA